MEKMKIKFNEVYFGNNSVDNQWKSQFLSCNIKNISISKLPLRVAVNIKNISISKLPLRVAGILFIFGRHMLNKIPAAP